MTGSLHELSSAHTAVVVEQAMLDEMIKFLVRNKGKGRVELDFDISCLIVPCLREM